jgi:hypothetical protein
VDWGALPSWHDCRAAPGSPLTEDTFDSNNDTNTDDNNEERHKVHKRRNLPPLQKLPTSQHNGSTETEPHFISHVKAFFAPPNSIVNENLISNSATKVMAPTAQCFYGFQIAVGTIQSKKYSLFIDMCVKDPTEKLHLLNAIETVPCVQHKANWALKWCDPTNTSFSEQRIAFAAVEVEGIFFVSSFFATFWLKKRGLMPGHSFSNKSSFMTNGYTATLHVSSTPN